MRNYFKSDLAFYEGVPIYKIYLLRLLFILMAFFLGYDSWQHILAHRGPWNNTDAVAWSVWGSYAILSFIGIFRPLKMLPIVMLEILYKTIWLLMVSYPLWVNGELAGSPAEETTYVFLIVVLPIIAMPWKYFIKTFITGRGIPVG